MAEELTIRAAYDARFGTMQLNVDGVIRLKLRDLIESLKLPPADLAALLEDRYQWTEGNSDIEPARLRMLNETDWTGKTVLDIGGYDGFAAEIAHKGGAARAICLDNHQYEHYGWEDKKKEGVEYFTGDVMDCYSNVDDPEQFIELRTPNRWLPRPHVLINYNVLYHVKNPWAFLDRCRELIFPNGQMLLCTLFRYHKGPWMYVYEAKECNPEDSSVFWGPSLEALERLLKFTGWEFKQEGLAYDRVVYRCFPTLEPRFRDSKY